MLYTFNGHLKMKNLQTKTKIMINTIKITKCIQILMKKRESKIVKNNFL